MSGPAPSTGGIDVDRLMDDLKRRAQRRREAGEVDPRVLDMPFRPQDDPSPGVSIRLRPEVAYSSKPGVGRAITLAKRTLIKMQFHFLNDIVTQANTALTRLEDDLRDERRARAALERQIERLDNELTELRRQGAGTESPADPGA